MVCREQYQCDVGVTMASASRVAARTANALQSTEQRLENLEAQVQELHLMLLAMMTAKQQERYLALSNGEAEDDTDN